MRSVIPPVDLAPYLLHSRVGHSCLLTGLIHTAYFQELHSLLDRTRCQGMLDGYLIISPLLFSFFS